VNADQHCWKACWGQPLRSSSDQAIHNPGHAFGPGLQGCAVSFVVSFILRISVQSIAKVQAHASKCYSSCGRPWGVSALSDQPAAGPSRWGERLGSDDAQVLPADSESWVATLGSGPVLRNGQLCDVVDCRYISSDAPIFGMLSVPCQQRPGAVRWCRAGRLRQPASSRQARGASR
jgi:hypothetical protein